MNYLLSDIARICSGRLLLKANDEQIDNIYFDSRKISRTSNSIFLALKSKASDGHHFINDAYQKGIRSFIVQDDYRDNAYPDASFIIVEDTLSAIQVLAKHHRQSFNIPVIGITGSNGKTIVKEWLYQCLSRKQNVCKSPLSYNSQLGVALSVLQLDKLHDIAIFEAGISESGEMHNLKAMIQPSIGVFTTLGDAHNSGFESREEKLSEKMSLFEDAEILIYNKASYGTDSSFAERRNSNHLTWGEHSSDDIKINKGQGKSYQISYLNKTYRIDIPFEIKFMVDNCLTVISYLIYAQWNQEDIQSAINELEGLPNRLEIKEGINNCIVLDDSYSLDVHSLKLGLENLMNYGVDNHKILIISDIDHQKNKAKVLEEIADMINQHDLELIITIGCEERFLNALTANVKRYESTESCINNYSFDELTQTSILVKGARRFKFEKIVSKITARVHKTELETDFQAIEHNLRMYRGFLNSGTKIMAVIKAEAYGSGSVQIARLLESKKVDYLAVALVDEAIKIRKSGCKLPIMVLNIHPYDLDKLWDYNLEPEIYSIELLNHICRHSNSISKPLNIHLKLESGMHRLGIEEIDIENALSILSESKHVKVKSVFSQLSASEDEAFNDFTQEQINRFEKLSVQISDALSYDIMRHILNTGGIVKFNDYQYDMVRLGLGIYGVDTTAEISSRLEKAHKLSARILQIKNLDAGESTGYGRSGTVQKPTKVAVISIGYADGLMRSAGNGNFSVRIKEKLYPTIGHICMDVTMVDITGSDNIMTGDEVVIFDHSHPIELLAEACQTIPYEIVSRIAPRVKRIYIHK